MTKYEPNRILSVIHRVDHGTPWWHYALIGVSILCVLIVLFLVFKNKFKGKDTMSYIMMVMAGVVYLVIADVLHFDGGLKYIGALVVLTVLLVLIFVRDIKRGNLSRH